MSAENKRKNISKRGKVKTRIVGRLSRIDFIVFAIIFAVIGGYIIIHSFASTPACTTTISPGADVVASYGSLTAGQTLCLHGGAYTAFEVRTNNNGTAASPITIMSSPGERATITVNDIYLAGGQTYHNFYNLNIVLSATTTQNVMIQDFSDNSFWEGNDISGINKKTCIELGYGASVAHNTTIKDNRIHDCGNPADGNQDHAIYISESIGATITENVFWKTAAFAIHFYPNAKNTTVTHNVIDSSGYGAVIFASDQTATGLKSDNNTVAYNMITNGSRYGMTTYWGPAGIGTGNSAHDNCNYGNASDTDGLPDVSLINNTSATAQPYTNGAAHDYSLVSGSSCLSVVGYDTAKAVNAIFAAAAAPTLGTSLPVQLPESAGTKLTGSATSPLSSLFSNLIPGDDLCLHSGIYGQSQTAAVVISVSGTAANPITIESCSGETAQIAQLIEVTGSYIRLRNLKIITNSYPTDVRYGQSGINPGGNVGIWLKGGQHVTLEKSEITGATMSGIFGGGPYNQILSNNVHDNGTTPDDHGIYYTSGNSLIANNLFANNYDFGIQLGYTGSTNNIVANNTIVHNGFGGGSSYPGSGTVTFSGTTSNLFVNNISANNAQYGYKTYDTTNSLSHNSSFGNPSGDTNGSFSSISAMLTSNPLFVSSTDFHLQSLSPAINAGDSAFTPSTDYYGNARTAPDLGAIFGANSTSPPPDTTPPTTSLTTTPASPTNSQSASFAFTGSDNVTVAGSLAFQCSLDGSAYAACASPKAYTGLTSGSHTFTVRATDTAGNMEITPPTYTWTIVATDSTAPTISLTAPVNNATVSGASVNIAANASDNVGVAGVKFYLDPATTNGQIGAEDITSPYSVAWDTSSIANGTHALTAIARDAAGNTTMATNITVTVNNAVTSPPDTTPPSTPANLSATPASSTGIGLSWNASSDSGTGATGVAGYRVYRSATSGGVYTLVNTVSSGTTYTDNGLSVNTTYYYKVSAIDNAATPNESPKAGPANATTNALTPTPTPIPTPTPPPTKKPGDCNGNGKVDIYDLSILLSHWGKSYTESDFKSDGVVNIYDLSILLSNYGK